jgi:hypothetical protein
MGTAGSTFEEVLQAVMQRTQAAREAWEHPHARALWRECQKRRVRQSSNEQTADDLSDEITWHDAGRDSLLGLAIA